jgi:hypothetical protein
MSFEIGAIISDFLTLVLGIYLCYLAISGKRASTGLTPKSRPLPLLPVKAFFMLIGFYTICWSFIQFGLDFGIVSHNSKIFLIFGSFNNSIGRAFIDIFLITWFALFGFSMARFLLASNKARSSRLLAAFGFAASIAVIVSSCYLLVRLIRTF